ncbi:hypothetical protein ACFQ9U_01915 [Streptomyces sp. NPDC056568]|uniref:hypothetical protein n=1 Tax=Streptomyces sp. NPDC056568 TaxID=3345866 RepID=UPI00367F3F1F
MKPAPLPSALTGLRSTGALLVSAPARATDQVLPLRQAVAPLPSEDGGPAGYDRDLISHGSAAGREGWDAAARPS